MDHKDTIHAHLRGKLAGQNAISGAQAAWNTALAIRGTGGRPVCYYSEFNGFTVLDDRDPNMTDRLLSLEQRSKPYPG